MLKTLIKKQFMELFRQYFVNQKTGKPRTKGKIIGLFIGFAALIVQGIATSIDALSVGFTIADYGLGEALLCAALIAAVTFVICLGGILIGRKVGTCLAGKAGILGGAILIFIGLEIFITSWF